MYSHGAVVYVVMSLCCVQSWGCGVCGHGAVLYEVM